MGRPVTTNEERQEVMGTAWEQVPLMKGSGIVGGGGVPISSQGLWCRASIYSQLCCWLAMGRKPQFLNLSSGINKGSYFLGQLGKVCRKINANKISGTALA